MAEVTRIPSSAQQSFLVGGETTDEEGGFLGWVCAHRFSIERDADSLDRALWRLVGLCER